MHDDLNSSLVVETEILALRFDLGITVHVGHI